MQHHWPGVYFVTQVPTPSPISTSIIINQMQCIYPHLRQNQYFSFEGSNRPTMNYGAIINMSHKELYCHFDSLYSMYHIHRSAFWPPLCDAGLHAWWRNFLTSVSTSSSSIKTPLCKASKTTVSSTKHRKRGSCSPVFG